METLNREWFLKNIPESKDYDMVKPISGSALERSSFLQMALLTKYKNGKHLTDRQVTNILNTYKI